MDGINLSIKTGIQQCLNHHPAAEKPFPERSDNRKTFGFEERGEDLF
jgi:hypothetical protein